MWAMHEFPGLNSGTQGWVIRFPFTWILVPPLNTESASHSCVPLRGGGCCTLKPLRPPKEACPTVIQSAKKQEPHLWALLPVEVRRSDVSGQTQDLEPRLSDPVPAAEARGSGEVKSNPRLMRSYKCWHFVNTHCVLCNLCSGFED